MRDSSSATAHHASAAWLRTIAAVVGLDAPPDAPFVGIQFAVGTSLRAVAAPSLVDGGIEPPEVTRRGFWLDGGVWEVPRR